MEHALGHVFMQLGLPATGLSLPPAALRGELEEASRKLTSAEMDLQRLHLDLVASPNGLGRFPERDEELARVRRQLNAHIDNTASRIRGLRKIAAYALDRPVD